VKHRSNSVENTIELGQNLGVRLGGGEFIALSGDLGGGKTHFTKGIAKGLGITEEITSPTFVIEKTYETPSSLNLHHFDFYRLGSFDREIEAGIADLLLNKNNIVVIEWAKNLPNTLPDELLQINFEYVDDDRRVIELSATGIIYKDIIKGLK
jgi:tRNA threonylcarbamoyladenosine biosynthesis protein TsaE